MNFETICNQLKLFSSTHHTTSALPQETKSEAVYHSHLMRLSPLARESVRSKQIILLAKIIIKKPQNSDFIELIQ
jgi:hypothetical protein